jgi:hypothetical protein
MLIGVVALAGCPSNSDSGNAGTLWLAPDQNETHVKLVESPPDPY